MKNIMVIGVFADTHVWLSEAKKLGYNIIAIHPTDISAKWYYGITKDYIDTFFKLSYFLLDDILEIAKKYNIEFVINHPCSNDAILATGYINSKLNLNGVTFSQANKIANKYKFDRILEQNSLPRPSFTIKYKNGMDLSTLSYPCIAKPNYGSGSAGAKVLRNVKEATQFFDDVISDGYFHSLKKYDYYILQEYVKGVKIVGCHSIVHDNELIIFGKTVRYLNNETNALPYVYGQQFITLHDELPNDVMKYINKLISVLKLNNMSFDLELLLDDDNNLLSFIELNLRPAEPSFNFISGRQNFEYCIKEQIKLSAGLVCDFTEIGDHKEYIIINYFWFPPGKIKNICWPTLSSNVLHFNTKLNKDVIIEDTWEVNDAIRNGCIVLYGSDIIDLEKQINAYIDDIQIEYY